MGKIVFSRVDFRLIHGQVVTKWIKQYPADTIAIINDELAKNDFMADIYEMSAPSGVKVVISSEKDAVETLDKIKGSIFVLFKDIDTAQTVVNNGLSFDRLVVGGVPKVENKKMVAKAVYLNADDVDKLQSIADHQIDVTCQAIPEDKPLTLTELQKEVGGSRE